MSLAHQVRHLRRRVLPLRVRVRGYRTQRELRAAAAYPLRRWRTRRPQSFHDKTWYKMLRDHRPLLVTAADRVAVRGLVEERLGPGYLTELYAVTGEPRRLDRAALPRQVALKASHGCGGSLLVWDRAPEDGRVPDPQAGWARTLVRPEALDWDRAVVLLEHWCFLRYSNRFEEWCYHRVPPRVVAEELLLDGGRLPTDHKFYVFDGTCRLVHVDTGRFGDPRRNLFRPDWSPVAATRRYPPAPQAPPPPGALAEMVSVAETLGAGTDFVRVDLYDLGGRIVVGELTNYPGGGRGPLEPPAFDREAGSWGQVPDRYR